MKTQIITDEPEFLILPINVYTRKYATKNPLNERCFVQQFAFRKSRQTQTRNV
jgi:hypothetical protein